MFKHNELSRERAEAVVAQIKAAGGTAEAEVVDVAEAAPLDALAERVFARHGAVRLLVNNAGIETFGFSWEISAARWDATLDINVHGVVHGIRAFVPRMLACGQEAWIANLSSVGAFSAMPTQTAYMMSKHAVQAFTEGLFLELRHIGAPIHVSSVIPGMLKTSIFEAAAGADEPATATRYRTAMREMAQAHGMDLDEGCRIILEQIAAGEFWVSTQPEMTRQIIAQRIDYLAAQSEPALAGETQRMLD